MGSPPPPLYHGQVGLESRVGLWEWTERKIDWVLWGTCVPEQGGLQGRREAVLAAEWPTGSDSHQASGGPGNSLSARPAGIDGHCSAE